MPQPIDDFAAFTGQKPVDPADDFAAFTGQKPVVPTSVPPAPVIPTPVAHVGALQSGFDPMAAGASVGNAIEAKGKDFLGWLKTVPGRVEQYAREKEAENEAALQAQQAKLGKVGAYFYRTPILPPDLSLEDISESLKTLAQKGQRLWQAIKPNQAKEAAQNAEFEMQQRMKEIGGRPWTPRETLWFNQKKDLAKQMWAASETERAARKKAVQDFQERSANWIAPGTIKAKVMGTVVPLVAQATLAPETIPADMALNQLAQGQLNNPTQEQTFGQQAKETALGYGFGKFMMAGAPGVPVSRALQGLGVPTVAANVAGIIPTSVTNVLGGHELSRYLTTDHGEAPPVPGLQDYLSDMAMQVGLQGPHLGRSFTAPEGAPAISQPAEVAPLPGRPLETPTTPGSLNAPPVESRPLPAPLAQSSEPVLMPARSLAQLGSMKPTEPQSPPFVGATSFEVPFKPGEPQTQNGVSVGGDQAALSHELLPPVAENAYRPQASPEEGLPDAYGLAPVAVEPPAPTAYKTLHDHEAEMAMVKQQRQADREALVNGPVAATSDIAPEHHAEADAILEARSIVTIAERKALDAEREILALQVKNRERVANGQEPKPIPSELAAAAKNRLAPDDPLRSLAAAAPSHPDVQRAMDVASELQRSLASEYAQGTPGAEGDITHAKREMLKSAPVQPTLSDKAKSFFFGIKPPAEEAPSVGIGKRPTQKDVSSNQRAYETVDGPTGPTVIYKGEPGDTEYNIVGRPGTIQEADITTRRESTKDEIEHATSQVVDPETGEVSLDPDQAIHFSRNAVASAASARETARAAARGRAVIDNLKANSDLFKPGEAVPGSGNRNVSDLPITRDIKGRLGDGNVPSDVANTLVEYFGEPGAREAGFWHWLDKSSRQWIERGFMTNPFIHFPNQFAHGLGALASEGMSPKQSMEALSHAYREGSNPNSEYVNRAKAAGVRQMSEGRVLGENANMTAHEVATAKLEAALGHEPGALGKTESGPIRNGFGALNQKAVWQVDDAIRNTLFYQKIASGMTPAQAAKYANENYVGYRTDTNLFELNHGKPTRLNKEGDPGHWLEVAKRAANYAYSGLVTGKGQSGKGGFQGAGGTLARTLVAPLFSTFRTNSLELFGHELKEAATGLPQGDLKGVGKLANIATVGSAAAGAVGQALTDALLTDKEKKQGKEYRMRTGGPLHIYNVAEKALKGEANKYQTMAAIATPNPIFKQIGKSMFGVDVSTGRRAPATSLSELGDTALSSVMPTGDIGRNALQGRGNTRDVVASFLMGKNMPNEAAQIAMAHPDKQAAGTPDYENAKANYKLISTLRNLEPGTKPYSDAIQAALAEHILTTRQIENASKRSNQSELEHMRALGKITSLDGLMAMADSYAERSPQIANALYADLRQRAAKESQKLRGVDSLKALGQAAENKQRILRQ